MMPGDFDAYAEEPEEPNVPLIIPTQISKPWSWDNNTLIIAALGIVGAGFVIWFVMEYTRAKAAFLAEGSENE
jgi:hypothetical protein